MPQRTVNAPKVIRRVRQRLEVSQEGLARLLNATKGAVQHWERGRNNPDLARLLALRQLCPAGSERETLDQLIKQSQARVAPMTTVKGGPRAPGGPQPGGRGLTPYLSESSIMLRKENERLRRQVAKLESTVAKRGEQLRILEDLAAELQREMAKLRAGKTGETASTPVATTPQTV